ncbi:MAG: hypothetical protein JOZ41_09665 [Chloroflexi bacterium]|nr:hypothetical protein [Chloroflexota bacterium]
MQPSVRRSYWSRNPWALPVILAVLILVLILGVVFGRKIVNSSTSATATPTATAASAAPTPTAGGSTPLPSATPFATVAGLPNLKLGMITRPQSEVQRVQTAVNNKDPHYLYHLDPIKTVQTDLPTYGFSGGFQITSPPPSPSPTPFNEASTGGLNRNAVNVMVSYQGHTFKVTAAQPGTQGPTGIWEIVTIAPVS